MWYNERMKTRTFTLLLVIALMSCQSYRMAGELDSMFRQQDAAAEAVAEEAPTQEPEPELTEEELAYLAEKAVFEEREYHHAQFDPSYTPMTYEEYLQTLEEAPQDVPEAEVVETVAEPQETPTEAVPAPSQTGSARIAGNEIPQWFTYTFASIFLALLFTVCYTAKQRKESYWHRSRD